MVEVDYIYSNWLDVEKRSAKALRDAWLDDSDACRVSVASASTLFGPYATFLGAALGAGCEGFLWPPLATTKKDNNSDAGIGTVGPLVGLPAA